MKPTLLILAAGMGSRYGGVKQIDKFGPHGESIIEYSIYDAIRAGFGKITFIIREELKADFVEIFKPKLDGKIDYDFAIQSVYSYIPNRYAGIERKKPWGTGHAVLCASEVTHLPFAVINADDFYGFEAFEKMAYFLTHNQQDDVHAMVGYKLKNTLSENGTVSRGVCQIDENDYLESVTERTTIERQPDGRIAFSEGDNLFYLEDDTTVSMNFWGFKPHIFPEIEKMFHDYLEINFDKPKGEFYIPTVMSKIIENNQGKCKVFTNSSDWFGVTYPEDKQKVSLAINNLIKEGKYPQKLWL